MKLWVVSDATRADADECDFVHFWTPGGLTRRSGQEIVASAKRAGWKDTIVVHAPTHREAVVKACEIFTKQRRRRRR